MSQVVFFKDFLCQFLVLVFRCFSYIYHFPLFVISDLLTIQMVRTPFSNRGECVTGSVLQSIMQFPIVSQLSMLGEAFQRFTVNFLNLHVKRSFCMTTNTFDASFSL